MSQQNAKPSVASTPETGKVHFLTRIPGRKETHLLGNADLLTSFEELMQQLGKIWGIEDTSECVLENSGSLLESTHEPIIIGTDHEWTFARERFRAYADSRVPGSGYDSSAGYCYSCKTKRTSNGYGTCHVCGTGRAVPTPFKDIATIPILIRCKPSKPAAAELDVLSDDKKAAEISTLTKERDEFIISAESSENKFKVERAAFEAQTTELNKFKAAYATQSDILTALAAAYLRETGKTGTLKDLIEQTESSLQGSVGTTASASSVGDFDVVDDLESTA